MQLVGWLVGWLVGQSVSQLVTVLKQFSVRRPHRYHNSQLPQFIDTQTNKQTNTKLLAAVLPHSNAHFVILQADTLTDTRPSMFNKTLPHTTVSNTRLCCSGMYHDNKNKHPNFHNFIRKYQAFPSVSQNTHTSASAAMLYHSAIRLDLLTRKQNGLCCAGKWRCGSLDRCKMEAMRSFERPKPSHSPHNAASHARIPLSSHRYKNTSNLTEFLAREASNSQTVANSVPEIWSYESQNSFTSVQTWTQSAPWFVCSASSQHDTQRC